MIITISAKCSDMCSVSGDGINVDGYVPHGLGVGGGITSVFRLILQLGRLLTFQI